MKTRIKALFRRISFSIASRRYNMKVMRLQGLDRQLGLMVWPSFRTEAEHLMAALGDINDSEMVNIIEFVRLIYVNLREHPHPDNVNLQEAFLSSTRPEVLASRMTMALAELQAIKPEETNHGNAGVGGPSA